VDATAAEPDSLSGIAMGFRIVEHRQTLYLAEAEVSPYVDDPKCLGVTLVFHSLAGIDPTVPPADDDPAPWPMDFDDELTRDCSASLPEQFQQVARQLSLLSDDRLRGYLPEAWINVAIQSRVSDARRDQPAAGGADGGKATDEIQGMAIGFRTFQAGGVLYLAEAEISPYVDEPTALGVTLVFHSLAGLDPTSEAGDDPEPLTWDFDDELTRDEKAPTMVQTQEILRQLYSLTPRMLLEYLIKAHRAARS
jgi:hypothetical protein